MQYAPTRVHEKFGGFHISAHGYTKNAPDFIHPNKDTPKTRPVLHPNLWRGAFRGVCNTPLHGYMKNWAGFIFPHPNTPKTHPISHPNLRRRLFRGVCFCAPTRVRTKFGGFHISASGYAKNAPGFIPKPSAQDISGRMLLRPYTGACKICSVLRPNRRQEIFRGVCNTPLHVYVQNPPSFIFPHMYPPKTHPISPFPIRIHQKPARF